MGGFRELILVEEFGLFWFKIVLFFYGEGVFFELV